MFQNSKLSSNSQLLKKARSRLIIKKYLKLSCTDGLLAAACCSSILFPIFSSWADSCLKFLAEVVIHLLFLSILPSKVAWQKRGGVAMFLMSEETVVFPLTLKQNKLFQKFLRIWTPWQVILMWFNFYENRRKLIFYRSERDSMGVGWTRDISNSESCQVNKPYLFLKLKLLLKT